MTTPRRPADLLALVGAKLARLPRRVVFVGGATTELFITDPAAPEVRATIDVDVIVEAKTYAEYMDAVSRNSGNSVPVRTLPKERHCAGGFSTTCWWM